MVRGVAIAALLLMVASSEASAIDLFVSKSTFARLAALKTGDDQRIDHFPVSAAQVTTMRLRRVDVYSRDARIYAVTSQGLKELPRSNRIFLRGYSDDGASRVSISLNPDGTFVEGSGSSPDGSFALRYDGKGTLSAVALESTVPSGTKLNFQCGNEKENLDFGPRSLGRSLGLSIGNPTILSATATLQNATVAVDTDTLFMSELFGNNMQQATNWIAGMFNAMNTMYERDLSVHLLQGTTFLRTSSDPYGAASDVPVDGHDLNVFAAYWRVNEASVPRAFATLLSGRGEPCTSGNPCSASGIAWIDQYCQTGFTSGSNTVGSYSVVQVFSNLSVDPQAAIAARLTGHELGHNFGAYHTHCTNTSTGDAPTGTNTIDKCYSGETVGSPPVACYSGATSCPSSGPGAPMGTIMSYCNIKGCPTAGSQNVLQFHPTQITALTGIVATESSCLASSDEIFGNGFEP
jgi:hypothetical protein